MNTDNQMQENINNLFEEAYVKVTNSSSPEKGIESFMSEHLSKDSEKISQELIKECQRIKNIKTIDDIGSEAVKAISTVEMYKYFKPIYEQITRENAKFVETVTTKLGNVNMNPSLHGNIFEQIHAATFNVRAATKGSNLRAYTYPAPYAENSVDISIKDLGLGGKIVKKYQAKCCMDASQTAAAIKSGNYNNQRILVPEYQKNELQLKFPGKSVSDVIEADGISSEPISYSQVKNCQDAVQYDQEAGLDTIIVGLKDADAVTYARAFAEYMKKPIMISLGIHVATGVIAEFSSEKFDVKQLLKNVLSGTFEDAIIIALTGAVIYEASKKGIELSPEAIPYVTDVVVGVYNICKTIVFMIGKQISLEQGLAQITEEIAKTAIILGCTKGGDAIGTAAGNAIGAWVGGPAGAAAGGAIGSIAGKIIGGIFGGIAGNWLASKCDSKLVDGYAKIIEFFVKHFNGSNITSTNTAAQTNKSILMA